MFIEGETMINVIVQWFPLLVSSLLAFWIYSLSKKRKQAYEKVFETVEFCGQKYTCVHWEEDYFMLRLMRFMNAVKQGYFGILYKDKVPLMALLPIEEFYRLKTIEEHLEDQEIGKIIEERVKYHEHTTNETIDETFEALRHEIYHNEHKNE